MSGRLFKKYALRCLRNLFCGALAWTIVARGQVSAARRNAFRKGMVTSIYFHNPNRTLFTNCVRWLKRNGYTFISLAQLVEIVQGRVTPPAGAVWLSFDDGYRDLLHAVIPVAREEHVPITLFLPSGIVEGKGRFPWEWHAEPTGPRGAARREERDAMTIPEVQQIAAYPEVSIGSHTVTHAVTPTLTDDALRFELGESKRKLEAWIGKPVTTFAYPVGQWDGREGRILAECGYELAATTRAILVPPGAPPFEIPRFHVGDHIPFREAVCNMVGIWHANVDPLFRLLKRRPPLALSSRSAAA